LGGLLTAFDSAIARRGLQTSAPNKTWSTIASSADGQQLIALDWVELFHLDQFGASWVSNSEPQYSSRSALGISSPFRRMDQSFWL